MKYGRILFAFAALSLSACVQQNRFGYTVDYSMPVLTTFKKHSSSVNISRKEYLTVGVDSVKLTVICRNGDERKWVDVLAPAHVSSSHIDITAAATRTVTYDGGKACTATLAKGVFAYEIRYGDSMYVTPAGGQTSFYGYRTDRRPDFRERVERAAKEGYAYAKETYDDAYEAVDDAFAEKMIQYRRGTAATYDTATKGAKMIGDAWVQGTLISGPM